jgi:hypothetical protein
LRLFLKGVQYVYRVSEGGDVDNSKSPGGIADTQFTDARTDRFYLLPVIRTESALDPIGLKACLSPSRFRKPSDHLQRISEKEDRFHIGCILYLN